MNKKHGKNPGQVHSSTAIAVSFEKPRLVQTLVEGLAVGRNHAAHCKESVPVGHVVFETASIEAFVTVNLSLSEENETIDSSSTTSFVFTCIKGRTGSCNLSWSNSLS